MKKFAIRLLIVLVVNVPLFYLMEEDKACVLDFGSKCSNLFIGRVLVQTIVLLAVFYFSDKKRLKEAAQE